MIRNYNCSTRLNQHDIAKRLKKARLSRGYSIEELANEMDVAESTIRAYEKYSEVNNEGYDENKKAVRNPSDENKVKYEQILNYSVYDLFFNPEDTIECRER